MPGKFGAKDLLEKLEDKFLIDDGCWIWTGANNGGLHPYGALKHDGRRLMAHRILYELLVGPIPEGLVLDHLCRNEKCVRPDHLEPVTIGENVLRGVGPAAVRARQTHCQRGHALEGLNLRIRTTGRRMCNTCANDRRRDRRRRS